MNRLLLSIVAAAMCAATFGVGAAQAEDKRVEITAGADSASPSMDEWIEQTKHPTDWWSWGADLRLRTIYFKNAIFFNKDNPTDVDERSFQRYRGRWWSTFTPTENIDLNVRLTWEGRTYDKPGPFEEWYGGTVSWDHLNVKVKDVFGLIGATDMPGKLSMTFGRQDIILGNGWLVLDGTPLDGSRTIFFDALRFDWAADENHSLSLIYIDQGGSDDRTISPFNNIDEDNIEQDERGVIAYYTNKALWEAGQLDAFFMYKHMDALPGRLRTNGGSTFGSWGDNGDIYCAGLRGTKNWGEHWSLRAEGAYQFGQKESENPATNTNDISAYGFNSRLTYFFKDAWDTQIRGSYEYLSGDDPNTTNKNEAFDLLWGRWPQFSELYVYSYAAETRIADVTNLHRLGLGLTTHPHEKIETCFDWHILFADENTFAGGPGNGFSTSGDLRGNLLTAIMRYKINSHMYGHVTGEAFFPGNYYDETRNDPAVFLRAELTLAW